MNRIIITAIAAVSLSVGCCGCRDSSSESEQRNVTLEVTVITPEVTVETNSESTDVTTDETGTCEGGGGNANGTIVFRVTVYDQKYFYDNQEISIEDLAEKIDEATAEEEKAEVIISDNHGSVKAFDTLTDMLDSKQITYTINEPS